mgnify:CR=1 FL=1|jgi:release factor glutamine methyltransferase
MNKLTALDFLREKANQNQGSYCQRIDIELMIQSVIDVDRAKLYSDSPLLKQKDVCLLTRMIEKRISGMPLAYILKKIGFWNLDLYINDNVLVPRPETESLIEIILQKYGNKKISILDVGTGSGAIALSLASEREDWDIYALDLSEDAIEVARKNMVIHNLKINFFRSSWLQAISENSFDLIVSNPPYIDSNDKCLLDDGLLYEPQSALVSKDGGYGDLFEIANSSIKCLNMNGELFLEHSPEQAGKIKLYLEELNYIGITCHQDLNGDERITAASKNSKQ